MDEIQVKSCFPPPIQTTGWQSHYASFIVLQIDHSPEFLVGAKYILIINPSAQILIEHWSISKSQKEAFFFSRKEVNQMENSLIRT